MESHYRIALDQALTWIKSNYTATGIIVSGSIIRGNPNKNSDFDIFVIHDSLFRQRVQKFFNKVPCEIFVNNTEQVYQYFESELADNRPVSANIIATGKLYMGNDNQKIVALVDDAKKYISLPKPLTEEQLIFYKYAISNLFEDATDIYTTDKITTLYILDKVVMDIIHFIFYAKQQPLPRLKDRIEVLLQLDPIIGNLIIDYYWNKLAAGGDPKAQVCGWLKDQFGLSWQIVPTILSELLKDKDQNRTSRVMAAMMQMKKIDLSLLEKAFAQP